MWEIWSRQILCGAVCLRRRSRSAAHDDNIRLNIHTCMYFCMRIYMYAFICTDESWATRCVCRGARAALWPSRCARCCAHGCRNCDSDLSAWMRACAFGTHVARWLFSKVNTLLDLLCIVTKVMHFENFYRAGVVGCYCDYLLAENTCLYAGHSTGSYK